MAEKDLSPFEERVLLLVQQGLTNSKIAIKLNANPSTISSYYLKNIKRKLGITSKGVTSRKEIIALAAKEQTNVY
jgi:DNA-binding CsgD family transcriptional regulator